MKAYANTVISKIFQIFFFFEISPNFSPTTAQPDEPTRMRLKKNLKSQLESISLVPLSQNAYFPTTTIIFAKVPLAVTKYKYNHHTIIIFCMIDEN